MAFPTTGILDDFNRADGPVGSNWGLDPFNANSETPQVTSNQFAPPSPRGSSFATEAWWAAADFGPDSECYATIAALPTTNSVMYVWARGAGLSTSVSTADCYEVEWQLLTGNDTINIYRVIDTGSTVIATLTAASCNLAAGDKLGIEVLGTGATVTVTAYKFQSGAWSSVLSFGDTDPARLLAPGAIGCGIFDGTGLTGRFDDFGGGAVAAPTYKPRRMPFA